jgi:hypothetical protein
MSSWVYGRLLVHTSTATWSSVSGEVPDRISTSAIPACDRSKYHDVNIMLARVNIIWPSAYCLTLATCKLTVSRKKLMAANRSGKCMCS